MSFRMTPLDARLIADDLRAETQRLNTDLDVFLASAAEFRATGAGQYMTVFDEVYDAWHALTAEMGVALDVGASMLDTIIDHIVVGDIKMASTISSASGR